MKTRKSNSAIENLNKKYSKKFAKAVLKMFFFGVLKSSALILTFFFFADKVGTPAEYGGPSALLRLVGVLYGLVVMYVSMLPSFRLKSKLDRQYRRERLWLSIRSFG